VLPIPVYAIPFFVLLLVVEMLSIRLDPDGSADLVGSDLSVQTGPVSANHPDQGPLIEVVKHAAVRVRQPRA
jgi:hypothetical protein